ncbi:uncharacterized protein LOC132729646 [Ruditapes philippinarum]|uniref:uncharacterized protein LOC132729646 n=1 Tax=Ruditapes philippinarum TaxID=129788 RepID=UPI00295ABE82|nr:uncharacterized protein LOC132729646 [Ruditapes philippinarum]
MKVAVCFLAFVIGCAYANLCSDSNPCDTSITTCSDGLTLTCMDIGSTDGNHCVCAGNAGGHMCQDAGDCHNGGHHCNHGHWGCVNGHCHCTGHNGGGGGGPGGK